jgi:hypothetical protein
MSTYPVIKLTSSVTIQPPVYTDTLIVKQVLENPGEKTVRAEIIKSESPYFSEWIVVWSGEEYDQIGQWTDDDLVASICAYYNVA